MWKVFPLILSKENIKSFTNVGKVWLCPTLLMCYAIILVTEEDFNNHLIKKFKLSTCVASARLDVSDNPFNDAYYM